MKGIMSYSERYCPYPYHHPLHSRYTVLNKWASNSTTSDLRARLEHGTMAQTAFILSLIVRKPLDLSLWSTLNTRPKNFQQGYTEPPMHSHPNVDGFDGVGFYSISDIIFSVRLWKVQQKNSLLKLHTTKRERALGALNGTLLCISLSASQKIIF